MQELRQKTRAALTGAVCSIPTPFLSSDDSIDKDVLARMIDFQLDNGFRMIFLTPGNSHFNILTVDEMYELNKFCVEYTRKRALVCVTEFGSSTKRSLEMAKAMKEIGADLFLPFPASWGGSVTGENLVGFYEACAKIIPLMLIYPHIVTAEASIALYRKLFGRTDQIMAIKDDGCNNFSRRMALEFSGEYAIFSGGQKQNYLNIMPYGACGFLSTLGMFRPDITRKFETACKSRDLETMQSVIRDFDMPYFDLICKLPGGFDAGIKATLELFGFGSRYRRNPYRNLTDQEMENFKSELIKLNILQ